MLLALLSGQQHHTSLLSPFLTGRKFVRWTYFQQSDKLWFFFNWTFSSLNMVQTVRQTLLGSQLACNEMQTSARTCGRHTVDSMIENVGKSIYFNHPSQGNSTNYYLILGPRRQGCTSHKSTNKQIPSEASEEPSDTVIHFYFCFFFIHRRAQPIRGNVHRIGRMFPEHAEQSFLDPKYSFITVWRILQSQI